MRSAVVLGMTKARQKAAFMLHATVFSDPLQRGGAAADDDRRLQKDS